MKAKKGDKEFTGHNNRTDDSTRIFLAGSKTATSQSRPKKKNSYKWTWILTLILILAALLSFVYMLFFRTDESLSSNNYEDGKLSDRTPLPEVRIEEDETELIAEEDTAEIEPEIVDEVTDSLISVPEVIETVTEEVPAAQTNDNHTYNMGEVSQVPVFHGGDQAMYAWLQANNRLLDDESARGKVVVSFVVEKNGSISDVRVVRGRNAKLDSEAVRLINAMPSWTPGTNDGAPVRVKYQLPITF